MDVVISNAPPGTNIPSADLNMLLALLRPRFSTAPTVGDDDLPFLFSSATPAPADRGKLWFRKTNDTSSGILVGTYFYLNGAWCKTYYSPVGTLVMWNGDDPTPFFNMTTGKGLFTSQTPGVTNDWYGWQMFLTSGAGFGYPNRFLMAADSYNAATGHFQAKLADGTLVDNANYPTGTTLTDAMIPTLTNGSVETNAATLDSGASASSDTRLLVGTKYDGAQEPSTDQAPTAKFTNPNAGEVPTPVPFQMPPMKATPMVKFIGYTYTDPTVL